MGFTRLQVDKAVDEMFTQGLNYDNPDDVILYLSGV